MANQIITTSSNHDDLTGRNAGEDITVQQGAILTIDSYPQETARGILGDILLTEGEVHIDGRYVREVVYASGTGTLPAVGAALTYGTAGTAKVIFLNSGTNAAGTMTITIQGVLEEPNGTITDGSWSATVSSSRIGLLKVFGEDQIWDATDATCTIRVTGDWYEIGTGTGADSQVITLPHTGHQHAVWVETGSATGVFEIWHRISQVTSTVFWDSLADWGNTFESGYVFACVPGSGTLTFGTSTNGGAPPSGARIRIPNVHMGTTTVGAPQTEVTSLVLANYLELVDAAVSENVYIDHLNASSVQVYLSQTNNTSISDSAIGFTSATTFITRVNSSITLTNCAFVGGNQLAGDSIATQFIITDNVGGITIEDCVFYAGTNGNNTGALSLVTMANLEFAGTNKMVANQQDENTFAALRGTVASNITNTGTLLFLNAGVITLAGCVNWQLGDVAYGQLSTRGATENTMIFVNATGTSGLTIDSGRVLNGAIIEVFRGTQFQFTDSSDILVQNFGAVDAKINCGALGTSVANFSGISNNITMRRVWYTNMNASSGFLFINSTSDITIENCSSDYNDEIEVDATRIDIKGVHGGSGGPGSGTGVEDDLVNCIASIFYTNFTSDTQGAIGLLFNDRGVRHIPHVTIVAGDPIWNGLGDMVMRSSGDQVIFTWPYFILGHTSFRNVAVQLAGVNTGNFTYEYDLDTGGGFLDSWQTVNGANLSAETISPAGFRIRIRITCATSSLTNSLRGFGIRTNTTLAAQAANLYPADTVDINLTGLQTNSEVRLYLGLTSDPGSAVFVAGVENSGTSLTLTHSNAGSAAYLVIAHVEYENILIEFPSLSALDATIPIQQRFDRNYRNP